jgi:hypothetical protein
MAYKIKQAKVKKLTYHTPKELREDLKFIEKRGKEIGFSKFDISLLQTLYEWRLLKKEYY